MGKKNFRIKNVEQGGQLYRETDEIRLQVEDAVKKLNEAFLEEQRIAKAQYKVSTDALELEKKVTTAEINYRAEELRSITEQINSIRSIIESRQKELLKNGKRDYAAEKNDLILKTNEQNLNKYVKELEKKSEALCEYAEAKDKHETDEKTKASSIMNEKFEVAKSGFEKKKLLSAREIFVKGFYKSYRNECAVLDDGVKSERNAVNQVDTRLKTIEEEFEEYKNNVKAKYYKDFEAVIAEKKKDRKQYRKFITKVYVIPENLRDTIAKNGYISSKELRKLSRKSPMEMLHDQIELQIQAEVNKKFDEYRAEIDNLSKVREQNMPALNSVEGKKAELKQKLDKSIEKVNKNMLEEARKKGIVLDPKDIRKSSELFKELSIKENKSNSDKADSKKVTKSADASRSTKAASSKNTTKKAAKNGEEKDTSTKTSMSKKFFNSILTKIQSVVDKRYEKKMRRKEELIKEIEKEKQSKLNNILSRYGDLNNLESMVVSSDEVAKSDLAKTERKDKCRTPRSGERL